MAKTTISDVAKRAGVSASTVSRVISGSSKISDKTSIKVKEVMKELNYYPNAIARSLVISKTNNIGIVIPSNDADFFYNYFFQESLQGIVKTASRANFNVLLSSNSFHESDALKELILKNKVDGVILLRAYEEDRCLMVLEDYKFPYTLIGTSTEYESTHCIDNDNIAVSYELTKYMLERCSGRVAFLGGDIRTNYTMFLLKGYRRALSDANVSYNDGYVVFGRDEAVFNDCLRAMFKQPNPPNGIIALDDGICLCILNICKDIGINIPQQLKIASFNNSLFTMQNNPSITAIDISSKRLGERACEVLINILNDVEMPKLCLIPHKIIVRQSS